MKIGRVIHNLSQGDKTLYIALISVFLPYPVTAVVLVVLGLSLWINPKSRTLLVRNRINCILIGTFSLINLIVGIIFGNWFGIMAACAFLLIITLFEYSQDDWDINSPLNRQKPLEITKQKPDKERKKMNRNATRIFKTKEKKR